MQSETPPPIPSPDPPIPPSAPADPDGESADPARPPRRPRLRGPVLLIACAALLGTVAGVATGYTVQADRDPTPLPPLSQPELAYPAKPLPKGEEPEPISAKHDPRFRTDGDLRKLLLEKPKGARDPDPLFTTDDGWTSLTEYARIHQDAAHSFQYLVGADFRRIAVDTWREGANRTVSIHLIQFHDYKAHAARTHARGRINGLTMDFHFGPEGTPLKNTGNGRYFVFDEQVGGGGPAHSATAIARRGDIMMEIWISDSKPVGEKAIRDLAQRQLERL